MRFRVSHITHYVYSSPASESFAELRVWPQDSESQTVISRSLEVDPQVPVAHYTDYFGNKVEYFSIPNQHREVRVKATAEVETIPHSIPALVLETPVAEALQIYQGRLFRLFDFLQPTDAVALHAVRRLQRRFFSPQRPIGEALLELNQWIYSNFRYQPGVTDVRTPLVDVVRQKSGVCQDFAHLMLAILRLHQIPARYVSGYIEAFDPEVADTPLVGAAASHAWVEVFLPGEYWWGLDPTNNKPADERHVKVAVGRDYSDVAPMRGTFKGAREQKLDVKVKLKRRHAGERAILSA
jgi:transglutaminase-like putative cysteine protease